MYKTSEYVGIIFKCGIMLKVNWCQVARTVIYIPLRTSLALSVKRSGTKLNSAVKGATLLQLVSLSADASQGPLGIYITVRARFLVVSWM